MNNCVTDNQNLPLSAAQGKALMDLYNVLNTNQKETSDRFRANDSTCTVMLYEKLDADVAYRLQIEQVGTLSYLKTNKAGQIITRTELANLG